MLKVSFSFKLFFLALFWLNFFPHNVIMIGEKFKRFAPLLPIIYISLYFGLLPYKWDAKHISMPGRLSEQDLFYHSRVGLLISYFYLLVGIYVFYVNVELTWDLANKYDSCFDDICWGPVCRNVCVHLVIMWVVYIGCISTILSVLYYRRQTTLQCLNQMNQLIGVMQVRIPPMTSFLILLFLAFQVTSFVYQMQRSRLRMNFVLEFGPPYLLICLTLANACTTGLILKLIELGHTGLNNQVDHLFHNYNRRIGPNITKLMSVHWKLSDLNELVSDCVRVDLMFMSICSTIRVIYFMFSMLRFLEESIQKPGSKFSSFQSLIFMVTVVGPFVSLCFRCNRVVQEEENSLISINALLLKARSHKDTQAVSMLSDFLEQAKVRQITFSACGLFTLNLRLVCTIFGITMTYFIVLVQFKTAAQSTKN